MFDVGQTLSRILLSARKRITCGELAAAMPCCTSSSSSSSTARQTSSAVLSAILGLRRGFADTTDVGEPGVLDIKHYNAFCSAFLNSAAVLKFGLPLSSKA